MLSVLYPALARGRSLREKAGRDHFRRCAVAYQALQSGLGSATAFRLTSVSVHVEPPSTNPHGVYRGPIAMRAANREGASGLATGYWMP